MDRDTSVKAYWKTNDIIRHKTTGHPFLVIHVYKYICTIIVDLESNTALTQTLALLPKDYDKYANEHNMQAKESKNDIIEWKYKSIQI